MGQKVQFQLRKQIKWKSNQIQANNRDIVAGFLEKYIIFKSNCLALSKGVLIYSIEIQI